MIDTNELREKITIKGLDVVADTDILELLDRLEAAESDAAHQKALADSALRVAEGWEEKCNSLRAKITEMERQEPIAWMHETRRDSDVVTDAVKCVWQRARPMSLASYTIPLYLAPGAKGE